MLRVCVFFAASATALALCGCGGGGGSSNGLAVPQPTASTFGSSTSGLVNGDVSTALFSNPVNTIVGSDGTIYVADYDNSVLRAISPQGIVSTLTQQADFNIPFGLAITPDGSLYVETDQDDQGNHGSTFGTIWRVDRTSGAATELARDLGRPRGLAAMKDGRLVCSDLYNSTVYIFDPATGKTTPLAGQTGVPGFKNGTGAGAQFDRPYGCAVMADGSVLVADQNNNVIRRVTMAGVVTTFAGTGTPGFDNGATATATFRGPEAVAVSPDGIIFVSDHDNHVIRRIAFGQVATQAGNGIQGYAPGDGLTAEFNGLEGMSLIPGGHILWVADGNNGDGTDFNRVRKLNVP